MTSKNNQSLFDISTQLKGDARGALELAIANDISITDDLAPGSSLVEFKSLFTNELISDSFSSKRLILASGGTRAARQLLGVGTMLINTNFDITRR